MRVAVVGTGHVGLVTCATLAAIGHDVVGIDADEEKIAQLQSGSIPFFEPELLELVRQETGSGRLRFTLDLDTAAAESQVVFICVGTPARADGEANLSAVEDAAKAVARAATGRTVIVEKSTVPAGTAHRVMRALRHERPDLGEDLAVVSNPEFLREGRAVRDSLEPDRILIGAQSPWAAQLLRELYQPLTDKGHPLIQTDIETAELAKHACNAYLALKISYMNGLARICERAGADVRLVAAVMGSDPRIGSEFLDAGLGYGGYCFPKDIQAFERLSARLGYQFPLLGEVARINEEAVDATLDKVKDAVWNLEGKRIALLGLAFKPGTDDVRFSPALKLAGKLIAEGATVTGYDPQAGANAKSEVPGLMISPSAMEALEGAHCMVVCTEWDEFRHLDLSLVKGSMAYPVIVDGRNLFDRHYVADAGFTYYPAGSSPVV